MAEFIVEVSILRGIPGRDRFSAERIGYVHHARRLISRSSRYRLPDWHLGKKVCKSVCGVLRRRITYAVAYFFYS